MEMTGSQRIEAPREQVWAALNDPEILRACIPGCQSLEKVDDTHLKAVAAVKVGPVSARFNGAVTLSEIDPPNGYRITGEGQGGAAGFAKGGAAVKLSDDGGATMLHYDVSAQVGGKLAQVGGPLIDATAKQMAGAFFKRLSEAVAPAAPAAAAPAAATPEPAAAIAPAASPPIAAAPAAATTLNPAWLALTALCAALAGFLIGRAPAAWGGAGAWTGPAIILIVIAAAWGAFGYGRASAGRRGLSR
ncbi:MAG: carbon monoxide dehydrogenase subunit G [Caulobacteraceae bacterium]|nr:carbon monoxide dehydrogenase subunit G [Caulobacteraceae bacterium]